MNRFAAIGMIGTAALVMITACKRGAAREGMQGGASPSGREPAGMTGGGGTPMKAARMAPAAAARVASAVECPPVSKELVDRGRKIFTGTGNCYACHGNDAHGSAVAPNLTDSTWLNIDGSYAGIAGLVRSGVPQPKHFPTPMPPGGGAQLDQGQLCAVAAYVYSLTH